MSPTANYMDTCLLYDTASTVSFVRPLHFLVHCFHQSEAQWGVQRLRSLNFGGASFFGFHVRVSVNGDSRYADWRRTKHSLEDQSAAGAVQPLTLPVVDGEFLPPVILQRISLELHGVPLLDCIISGHLTAPSM